ncbi:biofilm development regulator YmgB/AriR family protein [Atlantibacter sp.]|uniref:biofilm development regulator YmgB/AriR family protein n=1 Tax=Atlantibacter sp. TaxID=1903473 RepID=UPI0028A6F028|nr:biofilm development regulator YmgB/AriR family protein [Atlantibacter sp.]
MHSSATENQINVYFGKNAQAYEAETKLIADLTRELRTQRGVVQSKDLILTLIQQIECEKDVLKLDIYRNALEMIVQATPDNI